MHIQTPCNFQEFYLHTFLQIVLMSSYDDNFESGHGVRGIVSDISEMGEIR